MNEKAENMTEVERAEKLLDMVDDYRHRLANPCFSLQDMGMLVQEMETQTQILLSITERISEESELRNILNQVVVFSSVEIMKFNRGDYTTP